MNITLFVHCKTDRALHVVEHITSSVVGYWQELGLAADSNSIDAYASGRCRIFNTNLLSPDWQVQPSFERDGTVVSMSAIAVAFDQEITQGSFEDDLVLRVRNPDRLVGLLPPFFGCFLSGDRCGVFTDYLGVGRAYSLENADFFVASNHIGSCLFFERNAPEDDFRAWQLFSGFGWFIEDDSPFKQVKRLRPSTLITFNKDGQKSVTEYFNYKSLYSGQSSPESPAEIAAQMRTAAQNVGRLNHGKVIVDLSGGRDSRVTTAAFISSGTPCVVQTIGTISEEADVARRLMVGLPTEHRIASGNFASTQGAIQERLAGAMAFWDGDMAPAGLVARRGIVKIGGGGGEIAHGNFYGTAERLDSVRASRRATDRLSKAYGTAPGVTREARALINGRFEAINAELLRAGMRDASVLDGIYLTERFRRWVAAGHHTNSLLLFAVRSFVAAAMLMTP